MPAPQDRSAPKFDGHPLSLKQFFDEMDTLANACQLTPEEKIQHTLQYLEWKEYETWRSHPSAAGQDWEAFKNDILILREYYWNFITIVDWLLPKGEISRRERDQIFFSGFNTGFREKLTAHLTLKHLDHPLHKPWPIKDVHTAANFLLASNSASNEPGAFPTSSQTHSNVAAPSIPSN
ncbi:hypothetical protein P691DRAFT_767200 [Macrolepiota fuliginosa MF-IS2]|uniref:Uncharacterized protein n=1 Tax=Macrolepiota fuliginosa MF-IS2 TaxID=1400762 RepID=A0A9P5WYS7_9AGAR|nr:hypothetical protein P691DRAFT_767200 [Macrolepiota fuliginosa MF-IS2]